MATDYDGLRKQNLSDYGPKSKRLFEALGERLYTDSGHFVYELLQNAEDAFDESFHARKVAFHLHEDRLEVLNDGRPFSGDDVRAICGGFESTKSEDRTKIGTFGIGFKSVYAHSSAPEIHSGGEHFRIADYIFPFPVTPRSLPRGYRTLFVLPFKNPRESFRLISQRLEAFDIRSMLFLRNIESIEWQIAGRDSGGIKRGSEKLGYGRRVMVEGGPKARPSERKETWLVFERQLCHDATSDLEDQSNTSSAGKQLRVEIAFRLRVPAADQNPEIEPVQVSKLVAFFSTDLETHLGFLIQGPYVTTLARDNVPSEEQWNRVLVAETAGLVVEALRALRDSGQLTVSALETLPIRAYDFPETGMLRPIFEAVRIALQDERLLPGHRGTFISAAQAKLARGAELRELITYDQLTQLCGGRSLKWLSGQITNDRTPALRSYLIQELGIEEIDAEGFARQLSADFLARQSDDWMIKFYRFLNGQRALWRPLNYSPSSLRSKAIIRLENGSQVAPFRGGSAPNAYIPASEGTDLPAVKRTLVKDKEACEFLHALGLTEPDPVAEVTERLIPKYVDVAPVSEQEHHGDLRKLLYALRQASQERRQHLIQGLRACPFLRALNCATLVTEFRKPSEVYIPTEELRRFFDGNEAAWFLDEPTLEEKAVDAFRVIGLKDEPISPCEPKELGYVALGDWHGWHVRGVRGFDRRCNIDGLKHALDNISVEVASYIWGRLISPHRRHLHGTVQESRRQNYEPSSTNESQEYSATAKLLITHKWLPDSSGVFHKPSELSLSDLPEGFARDEEIARSLGMKPTLPVDVDKATLLRAAGLAPAAVRLVQENSEVIEFLAKRPELFERIRDEVKLASESEEPGAPNLDYQAELAAVFSRPARAGEFEIDGIEEASPLPNPDRRRQKKGSQKGDLLDPVNDYLIWFAKDKMRAGDAYNQLYEPAPLEGQRRGPNPRARDH